MAEARTRLEYLAGGTTWTKADTAQDASGSLGTGATAVVRLTIMDRLYSPSMASITLFNKSPNPLASSGNTSLGRLTGILTSFMQCRLIEEETGLCIFRGRIYNLNEKWDDMYGNVIELVLKDALAELQSFPLDLAPTELHNLDTSVTANNTRSKLIAKVISELEFDGNILTSDAVKFEASEVEFGATAGVHPKFDLSDTKQTALQVIQDLAFADPLFTAVNAEGKAVGFDYYVDPNITSSSATSVTVPTLNYFPRSTRPGPGSTTVKDPSLNSLTYELPADNWTGETAFKRAMAPDAAFNFDKTTIYTSVILTFEDGNETEIAANVADNATGANLNSDSEKKHTVIEFEKLSGTIAGTNAQFTWSGKNLNVSGTTPPDQLFKADGTVVATVQFQSGTGANEYLILSDINSDFPTSGSQTLYKDHTNQGGLASIAFNAVTDRPVKAFGIRKPARLRVKTLPQYDKIRTTIANHLVKSSTETVSGTLSNIKYPYFYIEAVAANAQRGSDPTPENRITFSNNAFLNSAGASGTNNPRDYGVQKGMVIVEVDSTNALALTRYAYISAVGATYIDYGTDAVDGEDTSDGTAIDTTKVVRIYIPLRAGDMVFVRNRMSNVISNQLILELEHVEEIGVSLSTIKSVGNNVTGTNRLLADGGGPSTSTLADVIAQNTDIGVIDETNRNNQSWRFTGTFTSVDHNTIQYTAGVLEADDGTLITIAGPTTSTSLVAGGGDLAEAITYDIYYDSGTAFSIELRSTYAPKASDIWMGWCRGQSTGGKAILSLMGQRLYEGVDASLALDEGSLGAALQSKGARPYLTDLRLFPGMVSRVAAEVNNSSDPVTVQVTDAADAQKFHVSATDNPAYIKIDDEILQVGSVSDTDAYLENCVRAQQGTAIATHAVGANVFQVQQFHVGGSGNGIISAYKELTGTSKVASDHRAAASVYFGDRPSTQAFSISPLTAAHSYNGSAEVGTSASGGAIFGNTTKTIPYFLYCDIPASDTATSLKATIVQTEAFSDDKLFLGMMMTATRTQGSLVNVATASFHYSKTREGTISANMISANAIVADHMSVNSIEADSIKAGSIQGTHLQADMILGTNITATAELVSTTEDKRLKLTPSTFNAYTQQSTTDANYKWFSLDRENKSLYIGEGIASGGTPAGMLPSIRMYEHGIELSRKSTMRISPGVDFLHTAGEYPDTRILYYDGETSLLSHSGGGDGIDSWYGSVNKGAVISTWLGSDNVTFQTVGAGGRWHPAVAGSYTAADATSDAAVPATVYTLKDTQGAFNAGMVGRKITRVNANNSLTKGTVTSYDATSSGTIITTSFNGWDNNARVYKLPRIGNAFTNMFGKFGQGTSEFRDYEKPHITGIDTTSGYASYSHAGVHNIWSNIAALGFEGHAYRMWQRPSYDQWAVLTSDKEPGNLGGYTEFGYTYNANSKGDSYKINWPHPDAEGSITVGQFLKIRTYETANTSTYYMATGKSIAKLTSNIDNSTTTIPLSILTNYLDGTQTSEITVGSSIKIDDEVMVVTVVGSTSVTVANRSGNANLAAHQANDTVYLTAAAMDGTKDRPYRMELEWADVAVIRSEVDIMTDGFAYG